MSTVVTTPTTAQENLELLAFQISGEDYAFPLTEIQEIIQQPAITHVPGVQSAITGILNLRGKIVTVVSASTLLGLPSKETPSHIIVTPKDRELFGFQVDTVTGVLRIPKTELKPVPDAIKAKAPHQYLASTVMQQTSTHEQNEHTDMGHSRIILVLNLKDILVSLSPASL